MWLEVAESHPELGLESESEVDERPSRERVEKPEGCLSDSEFSSKMDLWS